MIALALLTALSGCGMFSRYGPASQPVIPPPPIYTPPVGIAAPEAVPGVQVVPDTAPSPQAAAGPLVTPPTVAPPVVVPQNNVVVPAVNRDFAWDQIVDVVDDYFEVEQEERVKLVGDVLTEGRIDTFPLTGATLLEPWRRDSVNYYERLESTLQSIRRRAFVRVIPDEHGYLVDVTVMKELEDVQRPVRASAGAATFRYDTSLDRDTEFATDPYRIPGDPARPNGPRSRTAGWIPLGRDTALEQAMLAKIQSRLGGMPTPGVSSIGALGYAAPPLGASNVVAPQTIPPGTLVPPDAPTGPAYYPPNDEALPTPNDLPRDLPPP